MRLDIAELDTGLYASEVDAATVKLDGAVMVLVALSPGVLGHVTPDPKWRYKVL